MPDYQQKFPRDMNVFLKLFNSSNIIDFYLPTIKYGSQIGVENQCVVLSPLSIGQLDSLIAIMAKDMDDNLCAIQISAEYNVEFLEHDITKKLAKSTFTSPEHYKLLQAYKEHRESVFCSINKALYHNVNHSKTIDSYLSAYQVIGKVGFLDRDGTRHFHYQPISYCTYVVVGAFF